MEQGHRLVKDSSELPYSADVKQVVDINKRRFIEWKDAPDLYSPPSWVWRLVAEGEERGRLQERERLTSTSNPSGAQLTRTQLVVASEVNTIMQPRTAEDYEFPAQIADECQAIANSRQKPVVLLCKRGDRHVFHPEKQ